MSIKTTRFTILFFAFAILSFSFVACNDNDSNQPITTTIYDGAIDSIKSLPEDVKTGPAGNAITNLGETIRDSAGAIGPQDALVCAEGKQGQTVQQALGGDCK